MYDRRTIRSIVKVVAFAVCSAVAVSAAAQNRPDGAFRNGDTELWYRATGSGQPIVLLGGGPGIDVDYMEAAAEYLPSGFTRIFLEQRGTGRSQPVKPTTETLTISLMVEDLEALRVHLKQERLFLVGHSWGGMLAMAYAAAHGDRVDRLILIGSGGPTPEFRSWFGDNIAARLRPEDNDAMRKWAAAGKEGGVSADKMLLEMSRAISPGYFFERDKSLKFAAAIKDGSFHSEVNRLIGLEMQKGFDLRVGLKPLQRPVLIIHGHQDPVGQKTAEDIHSLILGSTLVYIAKCGHFPWLEQPEAFRRAVSEFLASPKP